ncbi:hypothetical protein SS7213T_03590, partial [Staphylococcus simiae CCM 7213 = CCUG 51256]
YAYCYIRLLLIKFLVNFHKQVLNQIIQVLDRLKGEF